MGMFGFDEQYAMFDVTPLDNQFILEELPGAKGDYVKVYLYGLLNCYHPQADMTIENMCQELSMTEEEVMQAYRYWERRALVRRVSDHPPVWRYVSTKQRALMHMEAPVDLAYADFAEALHAQFGSERRLEGKEISLAYEWVEDLHLPVDVVLMLVQHRIRTAGRNFSFKATQKLAVRLASENVRTAEDAEELFARDEQVDSNCRAILRRLGKRRNPSEEEMNLYIKWTQEWGYSFDAVEAACAETTKGEPNFAYLDGILRGMKERNDGRAMTSRAEVEKTRKASEARADLFKELMRTLNNPGVSITDGTLHVYDDMRAMYPHEVIVLAGNECSRRSKNTLDDVMKLLDGWRKRGLRTLQEIEAYLAAVNEQDKLISSLFEMWGKNFGIKQSDRKLVEKWQKEYGYPEAMILICAAYAQHVDKPMPYLDKILSEFAKRGVRTPDEAEAAHREFLAGKTAPPAAKPAKQVREQQYTQREYENTQGMTDRMAQRLKELKKNAQ